MNLPTTQELNSTRTPAPAPEEHRNKFEKELQKLSNATLECGSVPVSALPKTPTEAGAANARIQPATLEEALLVIAELDSLLESMHLSFDTLNQNQNHA